VSRIRLSSLPGESALGLFLASPDSENSSWNKVTSLLTFVRWSFISQTTHAVSVFPSKI